MIYSFIFYSKIHLYVERHFLFWEENMFVWLIVTNVMSFYLRLNISSCVVCMASIDT